MLAEVGGGGVASPTPRTRWMRITCCSRGISLNVDAADEGYFLLGTSLLNSGDPKERKGKRREGIADTL